MDRRSVLRSIAVGTVPAVGGCAESGLHSRSTASVVGIETSYPDFAGHYTVEGTLVDDPERTPVQFEALTPGSRIEVANGISRVLYRTDQPPQLTEDGKHREPITYQGSTFDVGVSVADVFREPEYGPDHDPDWREPVEIDSRVEGGDLAVTLTNELVDPLDVHHYGRPYFGVVTAVNGRPALLDHEQYDTNEFVRTEDVVRASSSSEIAGQTTPLSSGTSLRESYDLPNPLPDESTIWLSVTIGDDSIEMFGNRIRTVAATISIEA
jgi:hypothetical protein